MLLNNKQWTAKDIAGRLDHTVLAPDATLAMIEKACELGRKYVFKSVVTNPCWAPTVAGLLKGSPVEACSVAAFPLGNTTTRNKVAEVAEIAALTEVHPLISIDVVANLSLLKDKQYAAYTADMKAVVDTVKERGVSVKAILETALLSENEIAIACKCAVDAGITCVKTSTGRGGPPSLSHIALMRRSIPDNVLVKFSGFGTLNSPELAIMAFLLGADLLGTPQGDLITDTLSQQFVMLKAQLM